MLFNSYIFIFVFFPITLLVYYLFNVGDKGHLLAKAWLILASLFFYGWWNPVYLKLIVFSILVNYFFGFSVSRTKYSLIHRKSILITGIAFNLCLLAYFKYINFAIDNINAAFDLGITFEKVILPLGISFFTFQKIAYLVDCYQDETHESEFMNFVLFVTFFPQLIAGPIVHHKKIIPQFEKKSSYFFSYEKLAIGLTIFFIGLFKKVVVADSLLLYVDPVFSAAESGEGITFSGAWSGALAYTFQLYFDFSAYSDMAIGIAYCFGIVLPINFNSPYKALNISEFWRRWHITLSTFLRDYLYIPLGGNRVGPMRRYTNLMITMLLGGFWHGANWNFLLWGGLHGFYLVINHLWASISSEWRLNNPLARYILSASSWLLTFLLVVIAWVFFRAESLSGAINLLTAMSNFQNSPNLSGLFQDTVFFYVITASFVVALFFQNTQQLMGQYSSTIDATTKSPSLLSWKPNMLWAFMLAAASCISLFFVNSESEFLYFQF